MKEKIKLLFIVLFILGISGGGFLFSRYQHRIDDIFPNKPIELKSSNLPILIINTNNGDTIRDEPKITATLEIIYNKKDLRNDISDISHKSSGPIGIEKRGNWNTLFDKKSYGFETRDLSGNNRNVKLLGLPKENDWILNGFCLDKTLMRNAIAVFITEKMGNYTSRYQFCELVINGNYEGVYALHEKIKIDKRRLNISKLSPSVNDKDSITGGYIYEVAQQGKDFGKRRRFKDPKYEELNTRQKEYIKNYDDAFRKVMDSTIYNDPLIGYPRYIDVETFVDEIIVQELTKNSDSYGWSSFFYKDRGKKLSAGPPWDFDQALFNSTFRDGGAVENWMFNTEHDSIPTFWKKLYEDDIFRYLLKKRWFELRNDELSTAAIIGFVDSTAQYLQEAQKRNFKRWPVLGEYMHRSVKDFYKRNTYKKEVRFLKKRLSERLEWIDKQLMLVEDVDIKIPKLGLSMLYFNQSECFDWIEISNLEDTTVVLSGMYFSEGITYSFPYGTVIDAGQKVILSSDSAKFTMKFGITPFGQYSYNSCSAVEEIILNNSYGCLVNKVYNYVDGDI